MSGLGGHLREVSLVAIKFFTAKGHMTYPPLNLIPHTLWIPEMKRAGKNK